MGERPREPRRFRLLRDEIWWNLREALREGDISGLEDAVTQAQLVSVQYGVNRQGQVVVESKEQMLAKGRRSPDRADALALAFAVTKGASRRVYAW